MLGNTLVRWNRVPHIVAPFLPADENAPQEGAPKFNAFRQVVKIAPGTHREFEPHFEKLE